MNKKTKNKVDEYLGFKELLEQDDQLGTQIFLHLNDKKGASDFELMSFLEQDSKRLSRHIETFEEKVYMLKNYSQANELLKEQEASLSKHKKKLIEILGREDSMLFSQINELFTEYFNS